MSFHFADLAKHVAEDGQVTAADILALRRLGWGNGSISTQEAEALFALNHRLADPTPEWVDFFVEALGEFVVNGTPPRGYVDGEEAAWLIGALDNDGRLESMAELELLVRVMERSTNVPDRLKHYVLRQIESTVLTGKGPTRCGGTLCDSHITSAECKLLRRVIFASGGMRPGAVHRQEAEMLFRLKDATLEHDNAPEWKQLFVQGVGNYLTAFSNGTSQLSHERAKELETFMADHSSSVGNFFGRAVKSAPNAFGAVFGKKKPAAPNHHEKVAAARSIQEEEQNWLDAYIEANGRIDEFDQALLDFLAEERA